MTKEERIKRIHDTFILLMRISKRWFLQRLQTFNLTLPQFVALAALAAHRNACPMSDLTNVTFHDPPTMTGVVDRLVKMGLVQRSRSQADRRVVLVHATASGIDLINEIEAAMMQEAIQNYSILDEEELVTLERLLRQLLRIHLGQYMDLQDADLETEIEKLQEFTRDPIYYAKLEDKKQRR